MPTIKTYLESLEKIGSYGDLSKGNVSLDFEVPTMSESCNLTGYNESNWFCIHSNRSKCYLSAKMSNVSHDFAFSDTAADLAGYVGLITAVIGVVFNAVNIMALLRYKLIRAHVTTPFVISLSASDMLFSGLYLPILSIRFISRDWPVKLFGSDDGFVCQISPFLFYGLTATSLLNLLAVTMNRWVIIFFPNSSDRIFTRKRSKMMIVACWVIPLVFLLPSAVGVYGLHGLECLSRSCTILKDHREKSLKNFLIAFAVGLPTLILFVTNTSIYIKVKNIRKAMEKEMRKSKLRMPTALRDKEHKLTKMLLIIFICFLLSYGPGMVCKLFDPNYTFEYGHVFTYILNWASVVMNPAIYIGTQAKYRLAIRILFLGEKAKKRRPSFKSSSSVQGQEYGGAKFYVRQLSSSTEPPAELEIQEPPISDRKGILAGRKLKRQVSFQ